MSLQYSEINFDKITNPNPDFTPLEPPKITTKTHNKTAKKNFNFDMSELYEKIHKKDKLSGISNNIQEDSNNNMSDFKPLPEFNPVQAVRPNKYTSNIARNEKVDLEEKVNDYNENYYANVGYENQAIISDKNKDLLYKLNYIITLLEEQRDEKTNYVVEEVILYTFLGIFIIFVIDSFARASKYVR